MFICSSRTWWSFVHTLLVVLEHLQEHRVRQQPRLGIKDVIECDQFAPVYLSFLFFSFLSMSVRVLEYVAVHNSIRAIAQVFYKL
jgi:hypothetical protein